LKIAERFLVIEIMLKIFPAAMAIISIETEMIKYP
jgi:hypothetical protein